MGKRKRSRRWTFVWRETKMDDSELLPCPLCRNDYLAIHGEMVICDVCSLNASKKHWNKLAALRQDSSGGDESGSPLGGLGDVIAEYDRITDHLDSLDAEADFVMRGSDWREIRK